MPGEHRFLRPCPMRLVALGASNLTRGLQAVVGAARRAWGPQTEILAALGHGRSYGVPSQFLIRSLPGILQCGLWRALEEAGAAAATRAVVTDVGNDILYGFPPAQILDWVEETVVRLQRSAAQVTLAGLPVDGIGALSAPRFLFFRSLFVPSCRLSLAQVASRAERVQEGLLTLAAARGLRFVPLRATWYGVDPIHVRPSLWTAAWREILDLARDGEPDEPRPTAPSFESARLYLAAPERVRLFGLERRSPQPAYQRSIRLSLY